MRVNIRISERVKRKKYLSGSFIQLLLYEQSFEIIFLIKTSPGIV